MLFSADNKPKEKKQSDCLSGSVVRIPSPHTTIEVFHELKFIDKGTDIYTVFTWSRDRYMVLLGHMTHIRNGG